MDVLAFMSALSVDISKKTPIKDYSATQTLETLSNINIVIQKGWGEGLIDSKSTYFPPVTV